ncbi:MAG: putative lipid II flippase FtsW [Clostridiales bacterium]|nr:putative lipid II flippase FtsW [Clostridiales bacterium]
MQKTKKLTTLLIVLVLFLCVFGMVMIYSASSYSSEVLHGDSFHFVKKQIFGFVLGVALFFVGYFFDYHKFYKLRWYVLAISIILLVLVFIPGIGISANGARRWIGFGGFNLQSSEVAKFGFVIFTSCYLSKNYLKTKTFKGILPILLVGGVICLLVMLEPNMSVTMCIGMVMIIMLILGGMSFKHFIILAIPALALVVLLIVIEPYRLSRLMAFINPWANPKEDGYQLIQSLYSLGAGGLFGVGLFNSRQKYLFLPFAESDFIFAIIGEELGFVGAVLILFVYILIIAIGIKISLNARDRLGTYISAGIVSVIAIQLLINIAVVTGSIPPTGIPMPFISAGGTSLSVFMGAIGVLCNVGKGKESNEEFKMNKVDVILFKSKKKKTNRT